MPKPAKPPPPKVSAAGAKNDPKDVAGAEANTLEALEREFDDLVIRMRSPEQAAATEGLFRTSEAEFGQATPEADQL